MRNQWAGVVGEATGDLRESGVERGRAYTETLEGRKGSTGGVAGSPWSCLLTWGFKVKQWRVKGRGAEAVSRYDLGVEVEGASR